MRFGQTFLALICFFVWQMSFSFTDAQILYPGSVGGSASFRSANWTPLKLGAKLYSWYSPDNPNNTVSGGLVGTVHDQSGNGKSTTQADSLRQATLTNNCLNGFKCFTFDGSSDHYVLTTNSADMSKNRGAIETFFYLKPASETLTQYLLMNSAASGTSARVLVSLDASYRINVGGRRLDADSAVVSSNLIYYKVSDMLFHGVLNYAGNQIDSYKNGVKFYTKSNAWASGAGNSQNSNSGYVTLGASYNGGASWYNGSMGDVVITKEGLTTVERDKLLKFYQKKYGRRCLTSSTKTSIIMVGDSITASLLLSFGQSLSDTLQTLFNDSTVMISNLGISGRTLAAMTTEASIYADVAGASVPTSGVKRVLVVWAGTNDLAGGASVSTTYDRLKTYISGRKATGSFDKVVVVTPLNRTGQTTNMSNYRDQILANQADLGYDSVCDPWVISDAGGTPYGSGANFTSSTYWQAADGIHPTYYGTTLIAPCIKTAIQAVL